MNNIYWLLIKIINHNINSLTDNKIDYILFRLPVWY